MKKILLFAVLFGVSIGVQSAVLVVPTQYATIAAAVTAAGTGDEIYITTGTYSPATISLSSGKNLTFRGDGPGNTIIDGLGTTQLFNLGMFESCNIYNLTIQNGYNAADGGAIYGMLGNTLNLDTVYVQNSSAGGRGGGIYINGGTLNLNHTYLNGNSAGSNGGGIYYDNNTIFGSVTGISCLIEKTSFNSNTATGIGAGFYYDIGTSQGSGTLNMVNSTAGNHSTGTDVIRINSSGGTVTIELKNNTVANNSTGGLYVVGTSGIGMTNFNNLFVDNTSYDIGTSGSLTIAGDRNLLENISGSINYTGDNYYEPFPSQIVSTTFALNNGGLVPTLDLTDYGLRVAAGRARSDLPTYDQNDVLRRARSELGAIETTRNINVWVGGSSSWTTAANWTNGVPSSSNEFVIIDNCDNSNFPISSSISNLGAAQIVIGNFGAFENTSILVASKLFLMSNASGTGQFLNTGTLFGVTVEAEQYLFGAQWNFLGIPVVSIDAGSIISGATLATSTQNGNSYTYNNDGDYWIFEHDEVERATNGASDLEWVPVNSGNLVNTKGYIVWCDNPQKALFTGSFVAINQKFNLSYTSGGNASDMGWNLISNPYLSPFSWVGSTIDDVDQAAYFYSNEYKNYFVVPGMPIDGSTELVPQVQAFFAKANSNSTPSFTIESTLLAIDTNVKFKGINMDGDHFLKATIFRDSLKYYDETYIQHKDDALTAFEGSQDAYKLKNPNNISPQIYTKTGGTNMAVNRFSYFDYPNQEVPLIVKVPEADTFKLAFKIDESMGSFSYKLEDKLTGDFYSLQDMDTMAFNITNLVEDSRFVVHIYSLVTPVVSTEKDKDAFMYYANGNIYLKTSMDYANGYFELYDLTGKCVFQERVNSTRSTFDVRHINTDFVIGRYVSNDKSIKQKMILK